MVGFIWDNEELAYREEVKHPVNWCNLNNLDLSVDKRKGIIVHFIRKQPIHTPLYIDNILVEIIQSPKFLGVQSPTT